MRKLLVILALLFVGCSQEDSSYMPMPRQEKKEDLVIIPGSVIWEQQKLKPKKVVIEITFTNDSTYNYKVTTSR